MRLEFIDRVKENEVLGRDIYTEDGNRLLKAGITLTSGYIEKLKLQGVYYIYINDDRLEDISYADSKLDEIKGYVIKDISNIIKNISANEIHETKKRLGYVKELVDHIVENGDVNKCLYDIKTHDNYTYIHSLDTTIITCFLGMSMNIDGEELKELAIASSLHDIGKTKIPKYVLNRVEAWSREERDAIKNHCIYGKEILEEIGGFSDKTIRGVLEHHERVDGLGYPFGLKGNEISKFAKIITLSNAYDAVVNCKISKERCSLTDAYEYVLSGADSRFDMELVQRFKETFSIFPLGSCLRLSDGIEGYVVRQNKSFPDRPVIRVLYDNITKAPIPFYEIDLVKVKNVVVESIVR